MNFYYQRQIFYRREIYVIMKEFGMEYQAINACPNDHIIYYGQYAIENECPQFQTSRY